MLAQVAAPASAVRALEEVFAYWASLRCGARLPGRSDINPHGLLRHLPTVSLIDVRRTPISFRIRLAGTALYGLHGRETTGLELEQIHRGDEAIYWRTELEQVVERRLPGVGMRSLAARDTGALSVLWLRLPLASDGETVDMILGFDAVVGNTRGLDTGIRAA